MLIEIGISTSDFENPPLVCAYQTWFAETIAPSRVVRTSPPIPAPAPAPGPPLPLTSPVHQDFDKNQRSDYPVSKSEQRPFPIGKWWLRFDQQNWWWLLKPNRFCWYQLWDATSFSRCWGRLSQFFTCKEAWFDQQNGGSANFEM